MYFSLMGASWQLQVEVTLNSSRSPLWCTLRVMCTARTPGGPPDSLAVGVIENWRDPDNACKLWGVDERHWTSVPSWVAPVPRPPLGLHYVRVRLYRQPGVPLAQPVSVGAKLVLREGYVPF